MSQLIGFEEDGVVAELDKMVPGPSGLAEQAKQMNWCRMGTKTAVLVIVLVQDIAVVLDCLHPPKEPN